MEFEDPQIVKAKGLAVCMRPVDNFVGMKLCNALPGMLSSR